MTRRIRKVACNAFLAFSICACSAAPKQDDAQIAIEKAKREEERKRNREGDFSHTPFRADLVCSFRSSAPMTRARSTTPMILFVENGAKIVRGI